MASLTATSFSDLVLGTLNDLGPDNYQQIAQSRQEYPIFTRWFKKGKITIQSGTGVQRALMNRLPESAAHVGLGAVDNVHIVDLLDSITVPWVNAVSSWGVIYNEALMNRGRALVTNIIKPRREGAAINLIEEIENKAWSAPSSSSDLLNPWGIPYYVVKNATTGFNGGAPSGHTTVAGVDLTLTPTYKNYTFTFALTGGISKQDCLPKLRTAMRKCYFRSPTPGNNYVNSAPRWCLYVNSDTIETMETIGEAQNENLGRDLAPSQYGYGGIILRGADLQWATHLDTDTTNPIYGIDHETFFVAGLSGNWFRESRNQAPMQHNIEQYFKDTSYNYINIDRRRNFVGYGV